jgi:hypothetical protein
VVQTIVVSLYSQKDTDMTTTSTIQNVQNYKGQNQFIMKMKDAIAKYGSLTSAQNAAVEKIFNAPVEAKQVELTEDMKRIQSYKGENSFVKDIQSKLEKYGKLSDKQVSASLAQIQKEEDKERTLKVNWPAVGETLILGRKKAQELKETYGLEFNPLLIDVTRVLGISPKAIQFSGKMTIKRGKICTCCMRDLTDEFSMLTGMGKTCASHMKVPYIKDASETARFREDYLKRVDEIGEMEFWVPKKQIKKWDSVTSRAVQSIF